MAFKWRRPFLAMVVEILRIKKTNVLFYNKKLKYKHFISREKSCGFLERRKDQRHFSVPIRFN